MPNYEGHFENGVGRNFGNYVDIYFSSYVFKDLERPKDVHHDRIFKDKLVEIKAIRATKKKEVNKIPSANDLLKNDFSIRALSSIKGDYLHGLDSRNRRCKLQNVSFQQTKASEFDILLGFVFF